MNSDPIKRRLRRLRNTHRNASDFLMSLDEVTGLFDPDYKPDNLFGLDEQCGKSLANLLHECRSWRTPNDSFPQEFAAVQPSPVEMCGEIESSAHWLTWILSQHVLRRCCEAIWPGCTRNTDYEPGDYAESFGETDYVSANWQVVSDAVHLKWKDSPGLVNGDVIRRLGAMLDQEYERAANLVKSKSTPHPADSKTDATKWSLPETQKKWATRFKTSIRNLQNWRREKTLNMMIVNGQRGRWIVDLDDPHYKEWEKNRTSLND